MYPYCTNGHGEFEVLLTLTEWIKVHALQKFLQLSVDPHTLWNLLIYYLNLAIEYWQVCTCGRNLLIYYLTLAIEYWQFCTLSFNVITPDNNCNSIPPVSMLEARLRDRIEERRGFEPELSVS